MLLLAGAALWGAPAAGESAADVSQRARAILDSRYQTHLPKHETRDLDESRNAPTFGRGVSLPPVAAPVIGAGAELTKIVFIVLAAAVVVLILVWLIQALLQKIGRRASGAEAGAVVPGEAAAPERPVDVEDATRLAAEGRYGEAIHALLLAAIQHFAARAPMPLQASRTSRELARLLPLTGESRPKFNELVMAVERTLFGGQAAAAEDYQRSLERFRSLVARPA